MPRETSPAFQFYPQDFLSDTKVSAMTATATGVYIRLLCHCWLDTVITSDPHALARLGGYQGKKWSAVWGELSPCFRPHEGGYIQPRIERERLKQAAFRELKRKAGAASAQQRANRGATDTPTQSNSSSSSSSSSLSNEDTNHTGGATRVTDTATRVRRHQAEAEAEVHVKNTAAEDAFDRFWHAYPRKTAKLTARTAWRKLAPSPALLLHILNAVARHAATPQWRKDAGQFIPHPATWLTQRRWDDDVTRVSATLDADRPIRTRYLAWTAATCPHAPPCTTARPCLQRQDIDAQKAIARGT